MFFKNKFFIFSVLVIIHTLYFLLTHSNKLNAIINLNTTNNLIIENGKLIYANNCASCHGVNLEGQEQWRYPDSDGYMPAPPHDESGHTWHHSDKYLFLMTKYGLEEIIGQEYPNNMPAYNNILSDREIVAALSLIKSTWSTRIRLQHDKINTMSKEKR